MPTATVSRSQTQRLVFDAVSWPQYVGLGRLWEDRPLRITYDRGQLEIMTLSAKHERWKHLLGQLIVMLAIERGIDIAGFGSMTFKRRKLAKGLEPDECFWIQHERQMRSKKEFDVIHDPPPDLVLEIEVSRSALDRLGIYAALQIPEVWRFNGRRIEALWLSDDGTYEPIETSRAFSPLRPAELMPFLAQVDELGEVAMLRGFREWVAKTFKVNAPKSTRKK